jgi:hypothetical protein
MIRKVSQRRNHFSWALKNEKMFMGEGMEKGGKGRHFGKKE